MRGSHRGSGRVAGSWARATQIGITKGCALPVTRCVAHMQGAGLVVVTTACGARSLALFIEPLQRLLNQQLVALSHIRRPANGLPKRSWRA